MDFIIGIAVIGILLVVAMYIGQFIIGLVLMIIYGIFALIGSIIAIVINIFRGDQ